MRFEGKRILWLIHLRWIAVGCLLLVIFAARYLLKIRLPVLPLLVCSLVLLILNTVYHLYFKAMSTQSRVNNFITLQIVLDLVLLSALIHFSGGIENPFTLFFVFHMVIASILLSNRAAYLQATLAVFLLGAVAAGEFGGLLTHYNLEGVFGDERVYANPLYIGGLFFVFVSGLYITVYMTTTIVNRLREQELELRSANKRLEVKDTEKSQYVRTVSHDLKGSLAAIQNCLRVVLDGLAGDISVKSREMVARAERKSLYLLRFVNELLYLSMLRAGEKVRDKALDLAEIIANVLDFYEPTIKDKAIRLKYENEAGRVVMIADYNAIDQLLVHLVDNAVKYTFPGGEITVKVRMMTGEVLVTVADTGPGITAQDLPWVFDDFFSAESEQNEESPGPGLGLSIAREVAEMYGGKIRVESEEGRGSVFSFILPVQCQ